MPLRLDAFPRDLAVARRMSRVAAPFALGGVRRVAVVVLVVGIIIVVVIVHVFVICIAIVMDVAIADVMFDVIFIDGLHEYYQIRKITLFEQVQRIRISSKTMKFYMVKRPVFPCGNRHKNRI